MRFNGLRIKNIEWFKNKMMFKNKMIFNGLRIK